MNPKPTGTVTFLFTDIEGSTRLLQKLPDDYAAMLARHRELVGRAAAGYAGEPVDTAGDSCFFAFERAADAVLAAVKAQRALAAEQWPGGAALRVRMGLHTGTPVAASVGYVGIDVHRAARIASAAHGGQILLSAATSALLPDELRPEIGLRDMGPQRLKDLTRPENLFQVEAEGLASEFAPLNTLDRRTNNLPLQPTPLIGRIEELAVTKRLLASTRLLTLTGPGGTGKTRLALQLAADVLDEYAEGVYFATLAPITDPANVPGAVAEALPFTPRPDEATIDALVRYLKDKEILLLADNFEHMIAAATLVSDLLEQSPGLKVLVTSREPLGLAGEQEYPVPAMGLPTEGSADFPDTLSNCEAIELFVQRTQSVNPMFQLTAANARAVADVCIRLDGLPLSIELAAARMKLFTPQKLVERLDRRFPLLAAHRKNLPERQQTLRNTIDWSYNLLAEGERMLFARLAVFMGGFTIEAAEHICGSETLSPLPINVVDGLDSLLNKSLLRQSVSVEGEPRFWMLETIREYAVEVLAADPENEEVQKVHADFFATMAETFDEAMFSGVTSREQDVAWVRKVAAEYDNMRAALERSFACSRFAEAYRIVGSLVTLYLDQGYVQEAFRWSRKLLESGATVEPRLELKVAYVAGTFSSWVGETSAGERNFMRAEELAEQLGDDKRAGYAILMGAWGLLGDPDRHNELAERNRRAMKHFKEAHDSEGMNRARMQLAELLRVQGRYEEAMVEYEASLAGRTEETPHALLNNMAFCHYHLGDVDRAKKLFGRVLIEESEGTFSPRLVAYALVGMALLSSDAAKTACLLATAESHFSSAGALMEYPERMEYETILARTKSNLDSVAFDEAWARGRAMSMKEAVAFALRPRSIFPISQ